MSSEIRKRIETRLGLFSRALKQESELGLGDLFFINIYFLLIQGITIKTGSFLKIGDLVTLWYNGKS